MPSRHTKPLDLPREPLWFKVTGMLNQNWAMVVGSATEKEQTSPAARIYFFDDHGAVFDRLEYASASQADYALAFNGFTMLNDEPGFEAIAGLPSWPLKQSPFSDRPVYSSGEFWRQPPDIERVTQRRPLTPAGLQRFVDVQAPVLEVVLQELLGGRKDSQWMWFVFPQLSGLGRSDKARKYGIVNLEEAQRYLKHSELGPRLHQCFALVLEHEHKSAENIFGYIDAMKFRSCCTLFEQADCGEDSVFRRALRRFYDGKRDLKTMELL